MDINKLELARAKAMKDMSTKRASAGELAERREERELAKALERYKSEDSDWYARVVVVIGLMQQDQRVPPEKMNRLQRELAARHVGQMRRLLGEKGIQWQAG